MNWCELDCVLIFAYESNGIVYFVHKVPSSTVMTKLLAVAMIASDIYSPMTNELFKVDKLVQKSTKILKVFGYAWILLQYWCVSAVQEQAAQLEILKVFQLLKIFHVLEEYFWL